MEATITKEQAAALPAAAFGGRIVVVERDDDVEQACRDLAAHGVLGFDTETRPSFEAGKVNRVALLQLSTPDCCYLFRLCRIRFSRELVRILEDGKILKIGAAVSGDLDALHQRAHFRAAGFVDLQSIVGEWGVAEKSLSKMSAIVLGLHVSKAQRLSNWAARELTPRQQMYAATDAWICTKIYERLLRTPKTTKRKRHDSASTSATR